MTLDDAVALVTDLQRSVLRILAAGSQAGMGDERLAALAVRMRATAHPGLMRLADLAERVCGATDTFGSSRGLFDLHLALTAFRASTAAVGVVGEVVDVVNEPWVIANRVENTW